MEFGNENAIEEITIRKTGYANLIDSYLSSEEAEAGFRDLKARGYSPYIMEDQDNVFRLMIGAFLTEKGALDQADELNSVNIGSKVVRR